MEINLHGCISIEMDEREYNFCTVTTVTVTTKHQERLHLKLFHDKENNILFDFMDNFDNTPTKNSGGDVIQLKPLVAWSEVV